jgi:putative DNA primase/helicase
MASNYNDVLAQLLAAGLQVDHLDVGRMRRCKVEGDRERRGWYSLHEIRTEAGDDLIVGTFGVWRGTDNNAMKVELKKGTLNKEQVAAMRARLAEDMKRADMARKAEGERAAQEASATWGKCLPDGDCEYLHSKGVQAHGVRFTKTGVMAIPMLDTANKVHGLQIIRPKAVAKAKRKPEKEFWPAGMIKKGHFHLFGGVPTTVGLVGEGYATMASVYEAMGLPCVVAFDAGNLGPVLQELRKRYKQVKWLVCADDDAFSEGNPGVTAASTAAMGVGGAWVEPKFADEAARRLAFEAKGQKITDFNDLHALEGLHVVREQIQAKLTALQWPTGAQAARGTTTGGEGKPEKDPLKPIDTLDELLERFALVYGQGGTVFDHQEHCLVGLSDMRDACVARELHRAWSDHPDRAIVRVSEVGFDPACTDKNIHCNLWAGWPTTPVKGECSTLLDLLYHMCKNETDTDGLYKWVLRWLAYPIQHPGAKMKTTLVIHGPQGTGKNMFFESIMEIYGRYGRVIDQSAIEDKFNDWASRKLFLIADEVVARSDLYHIKNKLKAFITGEWIRINPKNMAAYEERNHVNMVFLSNEAMPVVLEEDDRRHAVIWTPEKLDQAFYAQVKAEIADGGVAALHDYLLHLDLGDFTDGTLPPMTDAKRELIDLGLDSPCRFVHAFTKGDVDGFPSREQKLLLPCLSQDFYELYQEWCRRQGLKSLNQPRFMNAVTRKHKGLVERKRYGEVKNPARVLSLPGGHEKPVADSEVYWLDDRIHAFRQALKDFKGFNGVPQ